MVELGKHYCDGQWYGNNMYQTFSLGCFEWLPRKSGGLKRGKVKVRVSGGQHLRLTIYDRAVAICKELDAGTYTGPKHVRVTR